MAILLNQSLSGGILARVPMAGGTPRRVLEDVYYAGADWAPDGKDLVVARHPDTRCIWSTRSAGC